MKETCIKPKKTVIKSVYVDEKGYVYCTQCPGKMKRSQRHVARHFKRHHKEHETVSLMQTRPINPNKTYMILSDDSDESVDRCADHCERRLEEIIDQ